ncbi:MULTISPECIES: hypothetical protein [Hymenobacter]|uniref:Secreted protein n=1 Tax=Hymenobacter armeniacus TaxID=2771358 RepID=A0ABR8JN31_9BACT|nr:MULTISPECIES: hypothetical protein [Hymenobacter]MBD2721395.1 hypothetical protein [Hymenobacter armeniacus]MBJ6110935.1 hypothetical protein [Hymenobacter sp. BT523]
MTKFYFFAAVVLFWVTLSASLMRVQLASSPVYKMRVPTYRSMPIRSTAVVRVPGVATTASYN